MSYMNKYGFDICQNLYQDQSKEIHNEYHFRSPNGFYLGGLRFPSDMQYAFDDKMLEIIAKALAIRYGYIKPKQRCK